MTDHAELLARADALVERNRVPYESLVPDLAAALREADEPVHGLSFAALRRANLGRCVKWHPGFPDDNEWTGADWSNAMCGEAGETANVVKKLRRYECGLKGELDPSEEELRAALADEIADTITYADLLAAKYGIDLSEAIANKFNRVSERQGFPDRLPESGWETGGTDGE